MQTTITKTFAITGSNGYIGQHLISSLKSNNYETISIQRHQPADNKSLWPDIPGGSHVVHLAGLTDVVQSWDDPAGYYEANALATIQLLEKCRKAECSLTYLSSYSYGQPQYLPVDESHPLASVNPYGLSKVAADEIVRFYATNYDLDANILRLFNTYGPNQQPFLLIPTIVNQLLDPETTEIVVKDLTPKRDYLHISDVVNAIIKVAGKGKGEAFNLGAGQSYSVEEIIVNLIKASERNVSYRSENASRKNEIPDVLASIDKLKSATDWEPEIDLYTGLDSVIRSSSSPTN